MWYKSHFFVITVLITLALQPQSAFGFSNVNDRLDHGIDLYDDNRFKNSATVLRELVYDRQFRKLDRVEKAIALNHLIYSLLEQGETSEALRHSNTLLKRVKNSFGHKSMQYVDALLVKAQTQYRMDKRREAIRTAEEMADIVERLGDDYSSELSDIRSIPAQIRKKKWEKEKQRKDLSDFYTKCEAIEEQDKLAAVSRVMGKYLLVGKNYRPTGREKSSFKNTYVKNVRENSTDRANRLIFIPDKEHVDDWCVVYPEGREVDRAAAVPPKD